MPRPARRWRRRWAWAGSRPAANDLAECALPRAAPQEAREPDEHEVAQRIVAAAPARRAPLAPQRMGEAPQEPRIGAVRRLPGVEAEPGEPSFELRAHVVAAHGADAAA